MRFLLRLIGFLLLAGGFVALVIDGSRAIASGQFGFTTLMATLAALMPSAVAQMQPMVQRVHPLLWDPVVVEILNAPTWIVAGVLGIILLWLGRRPPAPIGFETKS